jgi:hypothetical protein
MYYYISPTQRIDSTSALDVDEYPDMTRVDEMMYVLAKYVGIYGAQQVKYAVDQVARIMDKDSQN